MEILGGASIHTDGFRLKSQSSVVVIGEIDGPLEMGDNALLCNLGAVTLDTSRDTVFGAKLLNLGHLTLAPGKLESPFFVNMGSLTVDTASGEPFVVRYGNVYTYGSAELTSGSGLRLTGGANLVLDGVLTLGTNAVIGSAGYIELRGNAQLYGDIRNRGCVCIKSNDLYGQGGHIVGGLVNVDGYSGFDGFELLDDGCAVISCRPLKADAVKVYTAQELLRELERGSDTPIAVYGDMDVGDIVIRRDLYLVTGTVRAGDVTVIGACISTVGNAVDPRSTLETRSLTIEGGGILQNNDGTIRLSGNLRLNGSNVVLTSPMELDGGGILLEDGSLLQKSSYITGCGSLTLIKGRFSAF